MPANVARMRAFRQSDPAPDASCKIIVGAGELATHLGFLKRNMHPVRKEQDWHRESAEVGEAWKDPADFAAACSAGHERGRHSSGARPFADPRRRRHAARSSPMSEVTTAAP